MSSGIKTMSLSMPIEERQKQYEKAIAVPSSLSDYLKYDAYMSAAGIGLIALGARGLNRLRIQAAQPSISLLKRPIISLLKKPILPQASIFAGLGIFMYSTITKFFAANKLDAMLDYTKKEFESDVQILKACQSKHD